MIEPRETWHFPTTYVGRRVLVFDSLPSTNDFALQLNEPGTAIVADVQTAGRGQYHRQWQSPSGASLLLSVMIAPPPKLLRPVILIAWAAVAVAETIEAFCRNELFNCQTGASDASGWLIGDVRIKWPNDVILKGKKVCGILTENQRCTVVGLGLNLTQTQEDFANLPDATSMLITAGLECDSKTMLGVLLQKLDEQYGRLYDGELKTLENAWKSQIGLIGSTVTVSTVSGEFFHGRLIEMGFDFLELDLGNGAIRAFTPERIRLLQSETTV